MTQALRKVHKKTSRKLEAAARPSSKAVKVTEGSGNVFADIGLSNPEEHLVKAELVHQITTKMREQDLTQATAARLLGVTQPDVSKMLRGHFRQFSVERLMRFLVALGQDVEIVVHAPAAKQDPKITVTAG